MTRAQQARSGCSETPGIEAANVRQNWMRSEAMPYGAENEIQRSRDETPGTGDATMDNRATKTERLIHGKRAHQERLHAWNLQAAHQAQEAIVNRTITTPRPSE